MTAQGWTRRRFVQGLVALGALALGGATAAAPASGARHAGGATRERADRARNDAPPPAPNRVSYNRDHTPGPGMVHDPRSLVGCGLRYRARLLAGDQIDALGLFDAVIYPTLGQFAARPVEGYAARPRARFTDLTAAEIAPSLRRAERAGIARASAQSAWHDFLGFAAAQAGYGPLPGTGGSPVAPPPDQQ